MGSGTNTQGIKRSLILDVRKVTFPMGAFGSKTLKYTTLLGLIV